MLMVKGVGESHELKFSDAPISYEDLDKSFVKLINGASSDDCFDYKSGDKRERRFILFFYKAKTISKLFLTHLIIKAKVIKVTVHTFLVV